MTTSIAAGSSASFGIGAWESLTLVVSGRATMTLTSLAPNLLSSSVVSQAQSKTYGPFGVPMTVVVTAVDRGVTYDVVGDLIVNGALVDGAGNATPLNPAYQVEPPTRGVVLAYMIQFRGVADTAGSIGTIGAVIMPEGVSAAGIRLASGVCDYVSTINGSSLTGAQSAPLGSYGAGNFITEIYLGQIGLTAPYTVQDTGNVLAATPGMTRLTWTANLEITRVQILEMGPTNFAGTAGTGSARNVLVLGLK